MNPAEQERVRGVERCRLAGLLELEDRQPVAGGRCRFT